jgi:hypothetical protein
MKKRKTDTVTKGAARSSGSSLGRYGLGSAKAAMYSMVDHSIEARHPGVPIDVRDIRGLNKKFTFVDDGMGMEIDAVLRSLRATGGKRNG